MCAISISIPSNLIDKKMEQLGLHCTLKNLNSQIFTKVPFEKTRKDDFVCFEACEKHEAIQEFLESEIDFE